MKLRTTAAFLAVIAAVSIAACAGDERLPSSSLDTPMHHASTGTRLLDQGKYDDAAREFDRALQLDERFSPAYAGSGIVRAWRGDYENALALMRKAKKYANGGREASLASTGMLRIALVSGREGWLKDAEDAFDEAVRKDPECSDAYYFMGTAYLAALKFNRAEEMFSRVIELQDRYVKEADREWQRIQKIQRAMPGTVTGKKIALVESITRADCAALLLEELKINRVFNAFGVVTDAQEFKSPGEASAGSGRRDLPADVHDHVLAADIDEILAIGVRGLEAYPDGMYRPDEVVTRASFAMIVEDIIVKVRHDQTLATRFIGVPSPFPDVRSDLPYFNAAMVVTTRGIMQVKDPLSGEFGPLDTVTGADALLVIRKIRDDLKLF